MTNLDYTMTKFVFERFKQICNNNFIKKAIIPSIKCKPNFSYTKLSVNMLVH